MNNYFKYSYVITIYPKQITNDSQILNTTAYIINYIKYYYITDNPNEDFSFPCYSISENGKYYFNLFVKVSNINNNEETYFSKLFEIDTKSDNNKSNNNVNIFVIIFVSIFIIILLIFLIVCENIGRKIKILKSKYWNFLVEKIMKIEIQKKV